MSLSCTQVEVSCNKSCSLISAWGRKATEVDGRRGRTRTEWGNHKDKYSGVRSWKHQVSCFFAPLTQLSKYGNSEHYPVSHMGAWRATQTLLPRGGHMKQVLLPTLLWASALRGKAHPSGGGKHVSSWGHFRSGLLMKISSKDIHWKEKICCCW